MTSDNPYAAPSTDVCHEPCMNCRLREWWHEVLGLALFVAAIVISVGMPVMLVILIVDSIQEGWYGITALGSIGMLAIGFIMGVTMRDG